MLFLVIESITTNADPTDDEINVGQTRDLDAEQ